jgi:hypothetical protein
VAVASVWLPWAASGGATLNPIDEMPALSDLTKDPTNLVNGYYLLGAGIAAAVLGLLLLLKLVPKLRPLVAVVAIAAGVLVIGIEISTYNKVTDVINTNPSWSIGYGIYVGVGGGVAAMLGGLAALLRR